MYYVMFLMFPCLWCRMLQKDDKAQRRQRAAEAELKPKFFELRQGTELDLRREEQHQQKSLKK